MPLVECQRSQWFLVLILILVLVINNKLIAARFLLLLPPLLLFLLGSGEFSSERVQGGDHDLRFSSKYDVTRRNRSRTYIEFGDLFSGSESSIPMVNADTEEAFLRFSLNLRFP